MTRQWILRLTSTQGATVAPLRLHRAVEICVEGETLWLKGPCDAGPIERALWLLPGERFHLSESGQLIPWNHLLPVAEGPRGRWSPLADFLTIAPAAAALSGTISQRVLPRLIRTGREQPAEILLIPSATWAHYMDSAPAIRLTKLRFALSADARVLVRGQPLPSLPGLRYTLAAGIAIPTGHDWSPSIRAENIAQSLALQTDEIALFNLDGSYELIPPTAWVSATRSATRISIEGLA